MSKIKCWSRNLVWADVEGKERDELFEMINPIDAKYPTSKSTQLISSNLPFYNDEISILCLTDPNWNDQLEIYYLNNFGNLFRLNGTSPPIHEINAKAPILLTESNALDYLRFFTFFVHGEEGPFMIFESMDTSEIYPIKSDDDKKKLEEHIYPAKYNGINEKGHFLAAGIILYGTSIFAAHFEIHKTGMIDMLDDETILTDLSQTPNVLIK